MAGTFTHWMIANQAMERFPVKTGPFATVQLNFPFVSLGAIGPDYPYLSELLGGLLKEHSWADRMHLENTGGFVASGVRNLAALPPQDRGVCTAFLFGFATHLVADSVVHPIVNLAVRGLPLWNGAAHRDCEMTQDSWIFKKITNTEIGDSKYVDRLRMCSDPADLARIHPALRSFWKKTLADAHPAASKWVDRIDPDAWHRHVIEGMNLAAHPMPVLRHLGTALDLVYKPTASLDPEDRKRYVDQVRLPGGGLGRFEEDVFDRAVEKVVAVWQKLLPDAVAGTPDAVGAYLPDWDLDRGVDLDALCLW